MAFRSASRIRRNPACSQFRVNYCGDLKQDYRDMKDARDSSVVRHELQKLMNAIHTLPASTAECERGFSQMNLIMHP